MPIASADITYRLSGGAANALPNASLGGAMSSNEAGINILDVSSTEATDGRVEVRGVYVRNGHGSLTLIAPVVWLNSNTPSATTTIELGLGTSAQGGTEQTVANETTMPAGVTFSAPTSKATGIALGDIPPGGSRFVWIRRTVNAGTAAIGSDAFTLRVEGDTA